MKYYDTMKPQSTQDFHSQCDTWSCLVGHNAEIAAGIKDRNTNIFFNSSEFASVFSSYRHLLPPSGKCFHCLITSFPTVHLVIYHSTLMFRTGSNRNQNAPPGGFVYTIASLITDKMKKQTSIRRVSLLVYVNYDDCTVADHVSQSFNVLTWPPPRLLLLLLRSPQQEEYQLSPV